MPRKKVETVVSKSQQKRVAVQKQSPQLVGSQGQTVPLEQVEAMLERAVRAAMSYKMIQGEGSQSIYDLDASSAENVASASNRNSGPGTVGEQVKSPSPATPVNEALSHLVAALSEAHQFIGFLTEQLEPHMPRHLFDDDHCKSGEGSCSDMRVPSYSNSLSTTVNEINVATNEVDRLAVRINHLRNYLVV